MLHLDGDWRLDTVDIIVCVFITLVCCISLSVSIHLTNTNRISADEWGRPGRILNLVLLTSLGHRRVSVAQRQSVGLEIEGSLVRNSLGKTGFSLRQGKAQFAGSVHSVETSSLFAHRVRPFWVVEGYWIWFCSCLNTRVGYQSEEWDGSMKKPHRTVNSA